MPKHVHHDVIVAWAAGAEIQVRPPIAGRFTPEWKDISATESSLWWSVNLDYRVKPEPKPDVKLYTVVFSKDSYGHQPVFCTPLSKEKAIEHCKNYHGCGLAEFTWNGETGLFSGVEFIGKDWK